MNITKILKELKGWTNEDIAVKAGVGTPAIAKIINTNKLKDINLMVKLANAFDVPLDLFIVANTSFQSANTDAMRILESLKKYEQSKSDLKVTIWGE